MFKNLNVNNVQVIKKVSGSIFLTKNAPETLTVAKYLELHEGNKKATKESLA